MRTERETEEAKFCMIIKTIFQDRGSVVLRGRTTIETGTEEQEEVMENAVVVMRDNDLSNEEFGMCRTAMIGDEIYGTIDFSAEGPKSFMGKSVYWVDVIPTSPAQT